MEHEKLFIETSDYLEKNPKLKRILKQFEIDKASYERSVAVMKSNIIIPKKSVSNNTYSF